MQTQNNELSPSGQKMHDMLMDMAARDPKQALQMLKAMLVIPKLHIYVAENEELLAERVTIDITKGELLYLVAACIAVSGDISHDCGVNLDGQMLLTPLNKYQDVMVKIAMIVDGGYFVDNPVDIILNAFYAQDRIRKQVCTDE